MTVTFEQAFLEVMFAADRERAADVLTDPHVTMPPTAGAENR